MGALRKAAMCSSWVNIVIGLVFLPCALSACSSAGSTCTCDPPGWYNVSALSLTPARNKLTCTAINVTKIAVNNGICLWTNLAGQTPDANIYQNYGSQNNFACNVVGTATDKKRDKRCAYNNNTWGTVNQYYGLVAVDGAIEAAKALNFYIEFNKALVSFNCEEQYSHWNCDDCRKAYARWVCAMTMPACTPSPCAETKPCFSLCADVVRKCPVTLGFTCPHDNNDYLPSSCNAMGLANGAASIYPSSLMIIVLIAVVAFNNALL